MCLKLSMSRMIADRLPSGRGHARASLRRLLEETAPVAQTGQGIDGGEPDQFALHRENPLGGAQPRIKLLGQRRLADEIVGPRVERLDQTALVVLARHHQDIDRSAAGRHQARLPAKLDTGGVFELGAGDQRVDAGIGFDLLTSASRSSAKGRTSWPRAESMRETISRVVRLGSTKAMRMRVEPLSRYFKPLQDGP